LGGKSIEKRPTERTFWPPRMTKGGGSGNKKARAITTEAMEL